MMQHLFKALSHNMRLMTSHFFIIIELNSIFNTDIRQYFNIFNNQ